MTRPQPKPFAPEVQERAVRLVLEHQAEYETQWAGIQSVAEKMTLHRGRESAPKLALRPEQLRVRDHPG